jgi:hypothetical protein
LDNLVLIFFTVFCLFLWSDYSYLFQTPVVTGIDGYYYALQIESISNTGDLYVPTNAQLGLYFLTGISFLIGNSVIPIKIGAWFLIVAPTFGIAFLLQVLTKKSV